MIRKRGERWDVYVERTLDGIRIEKIVENQSAGEILALRMAETCLPGELRSFDRVPVRRLYDPAPSPGDLLDGVPSAENP